jgi:hypothetical protein
MPWFLVSKRKVLDAIGDRDVHLIQERAGIWVMVAIGQGYMHRKIINIRRVSDAPLDWWVARGKEFIAGDLETVVAPAPESLMN